MNLSKHTLFSLLWNVTCISHVLFEHVLFLLFLWCGQTHFLLALVVHHLLDEPARLPVQIRQFRRFRIDLFGVDLRIGHDQSTPPLHLVHLFTLEDIELCRKSEISFYQLFQEWWGSSACLQSAKWILLFWRRVPAGRPPWPAADSWRPPSGDSSGCRSSSLANVKPWPTGSAPVQHNNTLRLLGEKYRKSKSLSRGWQSSWNSYEEQSHHGVDQSAGKTPFQSDEFNKLPRGEFALNLALKSFLHFLQALHIPRPVLIRSDQGSPPPPPPSELYVYELSGRCDTPTRFTLLGQSGVIVRHTRSTPTTCQLSLTFCGLALLALVGMIVYMEGNRLKYLGNCLTLTLLFWQFTESK